MSKAKSKIITTGFIAVQHKMNPCCTDDTVLYTKCIAFLPNEEAIKQFKKTKEYNDCDAIHEIGKFADIDLD